MADPEKTAATHTTGLASRLKSTISGMLIMIKNKAAQMAGRTYLESVSRKYVVKAKAARGNVHGRRHTPAPLRLEGLAIVK